MPTSRLDQRAPRAGRVPQGKFAMVREVDYLALRSLMPSLPAQFANWKKMQCDNRDGWMARWRGVGTLVMVDPPKFAEWCGRSDAAPSEPMLDRYIAEC
jgi:hypothetical protein